MELDHPRDDRQNERAGVRASVRCMDAKRRADGEESRADGAEQRGEERRAEESRADRASESDQLLNAHSLRVELGKRVALFAAQRGRTVFA